MIELVLTWFVKDKENVHNARVRTRYGQVSGVMGICLNLMLCAGKFLAGFLTGAVSVTADAVNNLSDAGSSIITLLSFKLAGKPADKDHPFGHARYEYIASLVVAVIVLLLGVELIKQSVGKIVAPIMPQFSFVALLVLAGSMLVKLWMYLFNCKCGKRIDSSVMLATATDSLADVLATGAVLISLVLSPLLRFSLDGYMGVLVALFIIWSAIGILRETLSKLLGEAPTQEMERLLTHHILCNEKVLALHDMMVHNYGPGRSFATVHVEVDARDDIMVAHDMIDNIEREVLIDHGVHLVIHLDPVVTDDEQVNALQGQVIEMVRGIEDILSVHDFRVVKGNTHSNLIFDVTVPYDCTKKDGELMRAIIAGVKSIHPMYYAIVTLDRAFTGVPSHKTVQ